MILMICGAPGAGKGTQAELLEDRFKFLKLSTGSLLRRHVKEQTPLGKKIEATMASGQLVSDDILLEMVSEWINQNRSKHLILDGYPRNINQVKDLESLDLGNLLQVVHLDVPRDALRARLEGRRTCDECGASYHLSFKPPPQNGICSVCGKGHVVQRPDDSPASVAKRLDVYDEMTSPVVRYYSDKGRFTAINAAGDPKSVHEKLSSALDLGGL